MREKTQGEQGTVLMLVIIASFIMSIIGLATIYFNGLQEIAARAEADVVRANLAADAGIERGKIFIATCAAQGVFPENVNNSQEPFQLADESLGLRARYKVEIRPDRDNNIDLVTPSASLVGTYLITSTGAVLGGNMDTQKVKFASTRIFHGTLGPPAIVQTTAEPIVAKRLDNAYIEGPVTRKVH